MVQKRPFLRRGPSGPLADPALGIIQVGYDQAIENFVVPPAAGGAIFPRDAAGNPVSVVLPDVVEGNFLEVDWRMNIEAAIDDAYPTTFSWGAVAIVTFDGVDPVIGNADTFYVIDSWGSSEFDNPDVDTADIQSVSGLAAVPIPAGATIATVQLFYITTGDVVINNTSGLSASLKVSEVDEAIVSQAGPGNLVAT